MNYLLQRTKKTWLIQAILYFSYPIVELWQTAMKSKNPIDFVLWFWLTSLILLFWVGWFTLVINFIADPSTFENATFGVFDYI